MFHQRRVAHIGPRCWGAFVEAFRENESCLQRACGFGPRQRGQTKLADAIEHDNLDKLDELQQRMKER